MTPPSIAIVGASSRAAAASAMRAGLRSIAADLFADADLRQIATATRIAPYPDGFIDWLRAVEPPAWMYTGALENHPELIDQMAWIAPLWGNPGDVLARVRSPWELACALRSAGLLFPETRASAEGLHRDGTWLAKTCRGASGSGVRVLEGEHDGSMETDDSVIYQRRIDGTPCAAAYVAAEGAATLLGITRQLIGEPWLGARGFQFAGAIGPWPVSKSTHTALARIGNLLAAECELAGLFGVDFILSGDDVWPLEVNPRYTASVEIIERITGISALAAHVTACGGTTIHIPQSEIRNRGTHGKAILFAKHEVEINQTFADHALTEALGTPWPTLADVPSAGTVVETGRPILTVFADGSAAEEVERRLRERVAKLENNLYCYE